MGVVDEAPQRSPLARSWFALAVAGIAIIVGVLVGYSDAHGDTKSDAREAFICAAARGWRATYGAAPDLQVIVSDVTFHATPGRAPPTARRG